VRAYDYITPFAKAAAAGKTKSHVSIGGRLKYHGDSYKGRQRPMSPEDQAVMRAIVREEVAVVREEVAVVRGEVAVVREEVAVVRTEITAVEQRSIERQDRAVEA
jgi:hypothetical protein